MFPNLITVIKMNNLRNKICSVCLNLTKDEFEDIYELLQSIIDAFSLDLNLEINKNLVICGGCVADAKKCLRFKFTIINTEKTSLYITRTIRNVTFKMNKLFQVYKAPDKTVLPYVCRFCIDVIPEENGLKLNKFVQEPMFKIFPEVDLNMIDDPVICSTCENDLQTYLKFLTNIRYLKEETNANHQETNSGNRLVPNQHSAIANSTYELINMDRKPTPNFSEIKYNCAVCPFRTKNKDRLKKHCVVHRPYHRPILCAEKIPHKGFSKVTNKVIYKCAACSDKFFHKSALERHLTVHGGLGLLKSAIHVRDRSHVQSPDGLFTYECHKCNFQCKLEKTMGNHVKYHNLMYKCDRCPYKTECKQTIMMHKKHGECDDRTMYECDNCSFKSRNTGSLKGHMNVHSGKMHREGVKTIIYVCGKCPFKSRNRLNSRCHMRQHSEENKAPMSKQRINVPMKPTINITSQGT